MELSPQGLDAIFESLKNILQEGNINMKTQFIIENAFKARKSNFKNFPRIDEELDLVEDQNQITHSIDIDVEKLDGCFGINFFKFEENFKE